MSAANRSKNAGTDQPSEPVPPNARLKDKHYERELAKLQIELVKLQRWVQRKGLKLCIVFEGRDGAGKGGAIKAITDRVSPRAFRVVALPAPTEREKSQMYVQRYIPYLPAAGEIVIFDRSWYNRAGVERVMGFCSEEQVRRFLEMIPAVERAIVESGVILLKYWLEVSEAEQTRRLESRIDDGRKIWKLSPMDLKSYGRWYDYSRARDDMFSATDSAWAPWFVAHSDDKKRARLNIISHLLRQVPYRDVPREKVKLPKRQERDGYKDPDYPYRFVPELAWPSRLRPFSRMSAGFRSAGPGRGAETRPDPAIAAVAGRATAPRGSGPLRPAPALHNGVSSIRTQAPAAAPHAMASTRGSPSRRRLAPIVSPAPHSRRTGSTLALSPNSRRLRDVGRPAPASSATTTAAGASSTASNRANGGASATTAPHNRPCTQIIDAPRSVLPCRPLMLPVTPGPRQAWRRRRLPGPGQQPVPDPSAGLARPAGSSRWPDRTVHGRSRPVRRLPPARRADPPPVPPGPEPASASRRVARSPPAWPAGRPSAPDAPRPRQPDSSSSGRAATQAARSGSGAGWNRSCSPASRRNSAIAVPAPLPASAASSAPRPSDLVAMKGAMCRSIGRCLPRSTLPAAASSAAVRSVNRATQAAATSGLAQGSSGSSAYSIRSSPSPLRSVNQPRCRRASVCKAMTSQRSGRILAHRPVASTLGQFDQLFRIIGRGERRPEPIGPQRDAAPA